MILDMYTRSPMGPAHASKQAWELLTSYLGSIDCYAPTWSCSRSGYCRGCPAQMQSVHAHLLPMITGNLTTRKLFAMVIDAAQQAMQPLPSAHNESNSQARHHHLRQRLAHHIMHVCSSQSFGTSSIYDTLNPTQRLCLASAAQEAGAAPALHQFSRANQPMQATATHNPSSATAACSRWMQLCTDAEPPHATEHMLHSLSTTEVHVHSALRSLCAQHSQVSKLQLIDVLMIAGTPGSTATAATSCQGQASPHKRWHSRCQLSASTSAQPDALVICTRGTKSTNARCLLESAD